MLDLSDIALKKAGIVPSKVEPTPTWADTALIKAVAVRYPEAGSNSVQDFYDEFEKRKRAHTTFTRLAKAGEGDEAKKVMRDNVIVAADTIQKAMSTQLKIVRDAYNSKTMTADQKREFIDRSYLQLIKVAQSGNEVFKRTQDAFDEKNK